MQDNEDTGVAIDLSRTIGELVGEHPELAGTLEEIGLADAPADATLPELAAQSDVDMAVIAFVLEASGFTVENFTREPGTAFESPLPDIIAHFFAGDEDPDEPSAAALSAATPTVAKLERAVKRAQREGRLPTDEELGGAGSPEGDEGR